MLRYLKKLFVIAVVRATLLYASACSFLYVVQDALLYHPTPEQHDDTVKSFYFPSQGEKIKVWQLNPGQPHAILYFGGNAEAVEKRFAWLTKNLSEYTVYLLNYRSFGGSSGKPSEDALLADALALYQKIASEHESISAMGRSLGTGVAVYLASEVTIERLVLITPYDSILNVAESQYSFFPVRFLLRDTYNSIERAPMVKAKVLALLAEKDRVTPLEGGLALVKALKNADVEYEIIVGAGHNNITQFDLYTSRIREFLSPHNK